MMGYYINFHAIFTFRERNFKDISKFSCSLYNKLLLAKSLGIASVSDFIFLINKKISHILAIHMTPKDPAGV